MLEGLSAFGKQFFGYLFDGIDAGLHPYDMLAAFQGIVPNYTQTLFNRDFNIVSNAVSRLDNAQRLSNDKIIRASMYSKKDFAYLNGNYGHVVSFDYFNPITGQSSHKYLTVVSNTRLSKADIFDAVSTGQVGNDTGGQISNLQLEGAYKNP